MNTQSELKWLIFFWLELSCEYETIPYNVLLLR